jgi:hypothetical protein
LFCVFVERICSKIGDEEIEDEDEKKRGNKMVHGSKRKKDKEKYK